MHTLRERVWASPLTSANEEECSKEAFVIPIGQFFQVFVILQAECLVFFSTPDPLVRPGVHTHTLAKMNLEGKASGRSKTAAWHYPRTFAPQGGFLCTCSVFLVPKEWRKKTPSPLRKQCFAPLCHDYYLKVFTRDKHWLFTLFLLPLPFQRANRRLTVNPSTGAHLSLVSGNANRRLVVNV